MYDPMGDITKVIKSNKKCPMFGHKPQSHIEYFVNQIEKEAKESLEWEFRILD